LAHLITKNNLKKKLKKTKPDLHNVQKKILNLLKHGTILNLTKVNNNKKFLIQKLLL